jgi:hypothetical protein
VKSYGSSGMWLADVLSVGLNVLLMYPDRPYDVGDLYGWDYNPKAERRGAPHYPAAVKRAREPRRR